MSLSAWDEEMDLLRAMYPDCVTFNAQAKQLGFRTTNGILELRLGDGYPSEAALDVIIATGPRGRDLRDTAKLIVQSQQAGEPCLDAVIADFVQLLDKLHAALEEVGCDLVANAPASEANRTVIVWLHHLLATQKRKQALSPNIAGAAGISGITKPGYPGVMIFSGPATAVDGHLQSLKQLRWQAFQVRHEADVGWVFKHGDGVVEVQSMAEVVSEVECRPEQKQRLMEALKII